MLSIRAAGVILLLASAGSAKAEPILISGSTAAFLNEGTLTTSRIVNIAAVLAGVKIDDPHQPPWSDLGRAVTIYHCSEESDKGRLFCLFGDFSGRQFGTAVFKRKDFSLVAWLPKVLAPLGTVVRHGGRVYLSQGPYMESHGASLAFDSGTMQRLSEDVPPFELSHSCWLPGSKLIYSPFAGTFYPSTKTFDTRGKFPVGYLACGGDRILVQRPGKTGMELVVADMPGEKEVYRISTAETRQGFSPDLVRLSSNGRFVILLPKTPQQTLPATLEGPIIIFDSKTKHRHEVALPKPAPNGEMPGTWEVGSFAADGNKLILRDQWSTRLGIVELGGGKLKVAELPMSGALIW